MGAAAAAAGSGPRTATTAAGDSPIQRTVPLAPLCAPSWLVGFQTRREAWPIAARLLGHGDAYVRFFAASTLAIKLRRSAHELSEEERLQLRARLMDRLVAGGGPEDASAGAGADRVVLVQLCVALAALAIQIVPVGWPDPVADVLRLALQPNGLDAALGLLAVLPDQVLLAHVSRPRRTELIGALVSHSRDVLLLLAGVVADAARPITARRRAMDAARSWCEMDARLGAQHDDLVASLWQPHVLDAVVGAPHSGDAVLVASFLELVAAVASRRPPAGADPGPSLAILARIVPFCLGEAGDEDLRHAAIVAAAAFVGGMVDFLGRNSPTAADVLLFFLRCTAADNFVLSELTLEAWCALATHIRDSVPPGERMDEAELGNLWMRLTEVLVQATTFPDHPSSAFDEDDFSAFRMYAGDTILAAYTFTGDRLLAGIAQTLPPALEAGNFLLAESLLHAATAVAEEVDVGEAVHMPVIVAALPRAGGHVRTVQAAMHFLAAHAEWVVAHVDAHGNLAAGALQLALQACRSDDTSVSQLAARAAEHLCAEGGHAFARSWSAFSDAAFQAFASSTGKTRSRLFAAIANVVCQLDDAAGSVACERLLRPVAEAVCAVARDARGVHEDDAAAKRTVTDVEATTAMFRNFRRTVENPRDYGPWVANALRDLLAPMADAMRVWRSAGACTCGRCRPDEAQRVSAKFCVWFTELMRVCEGALGLANVRFLADQVYTDSVRAHGLTVANLRVLTAFVDVYGPDLVASSDAALQQTYAALMDATIDCACRQFAGDAGGDEVGAFFSAMRTVLSRTPNVFFAAPHLDPLIDLLVASFAVEHQTRKSTKALTSIVLALLDAAQQVPGGHEGLRARVTDVSRHILFASARTMPHSFVPLLAPVFARLRALYRDDFLAAIIAAIPNLRCRTPLPAQCQQSLVRIFGHLESKDALAAFLSDFSLVCRGMQSSETLARHMAA